MESSNPNSGYTLYQRRWLVLLTVGALNLGNNALWISYSSIADTTAQYFKVSVDEVDLLGTISFIVGIPVCLVATYSVNALGLKTGVYAGSVLTLLGGALRALSTLPGLNDKMDLRTQYYLSLVGQALTGMGSPFAVSLPTKVSQNWFSEKERGFVTGALAMSLPIGIVLGQGCTPFIAPEADDIPLMNIIWFIPALITQVLVMVSVTTSEPNTPPTQSSMLAREGHTRSRSLKEFLRLMKSAFTNVEYMLLFLITGGSVGFYNCISTQLSQMMCSRGYSNEAAGITGSLLLGTGFIGAICSGLIVEKYGRIEVVAKLFFAVAGLVGIGFLQVLRKPGVEAWIMVFSSLFGVFGFGMYPLALELSVEATYPEDETVGTALIFMSGQIIAVILTTISSFLEQDLTQSEADISVCSDSITPKDHTIFLMLVMGFLTLLVIIFLLAFKSKMKRTRADERRLEGESNSNPVDAT